MNRSQFVGYWISWPYSFCDARAEQHLHEDGRFEAKIIADERLKINCSAMGKWDLIDGAIQWTYESARKVRKPRRPQIDKILLLEENRFVSLEGKGPEKTEFWRGIPCEDTSTNFDLDEVQPFLKRLSRLIDAGFTTRAIASLMEKIRKLDLHKRVQVVFSIKFQGVVSPLYFGVFMDDIEAPDISFSGPVELVRQIDNEIDKRDPSLEG
jgi:hypothetical protein